MLLTKIGIDGCFSGDRGSEILNVAIRRTYHRAVSFFYPHIINLKFLVGGTVRQNQLAKTFQGRFALDSDAETQLALTGTVLFKAIARLDLFDDQRFLRIVRLSGR